MTALLKDQGRDYLMGEVYEKCIRARGHQIQNNYLKELYEQFSYDQVSAKISEIIKPADMKAEVEVVFQTVENLHKAIPHHSGDWYFTGNYPTPGGMKVVNRAYVNYMEGRLVRAY
jgi:amidophosphoribosyltransferase